MSQKNCYCFAHVNHLFCFCIGLGNPWTKSAFSKWSHLWLILHTKWTIEKRISLALNGLKNISLPFIVLFLLAIKHRMFLWTWARFLKGLVTFLGPKANFKITTSCIAIVAAQFLAHKPINPASLNDSFIVSFPTLLKLWSWMQTWQK